MRGGGNGLLGLEYVDLSEARSLGVEYRNSTGNFLAISGTVSPGVVIGEYQDIAITEDVWTVSESCQIVAGDVVPNGPSSEASIWYLPAKGYGADSMIVEYTIGEGSAPNYISFQNIEADGYNHLYDIERTLSEAEREVGAHQIEVLFNYHGLPGLIAWNNSGAISINSISATISGVANEASVEIIVDGMNIASETGSVCKFYALVPPQSTYKVDGVGSLDKWVELR